MANIFEDLRKKLSGSRFNLAAQVGAVGQLAKPVINQAINAGVRATNPIVQKGPVQAFNQMGVNYAKNNVVPQIAQAFVTARQGPKAIPQAALQGLQGAIGFHPVTPVINTAGSVLQGLRQRQAPQQIARNIYQQKPQTISSGLGVTNPFLALGVDVLAGNPKGALKSVQGIKTLGTAGKKLASEKTFTISLGKGKPMVNVPEGEASGWLRYAKENGIPYTIRSETGAKFTKDTGGKFSGSQKLGFVSNNDDFSRSLGPTTPLPGQKDRGLIKNVRTSPTSSPELAQGVSGTYTPISNKATLQEAKDIIKTDYAQARDLILDRTQAPTAQSTAVALELADQAQKAGRIDEAIDIVNNYAERLTTSGQASQAASIWTKLSPVSVLRKANTDYKQATGKPLPPEIGTRITQLAKEVDELPEGPEKLLKVSQMYKELADNVPSGIGPKLTNLWKATLLTATKTHIVNVISTAAFQTLENVSKGLGTLVDIAASVATKKRTVNLSPRNILEQGKALKEGARNAKQVFKTGVNPAEVATLDTVRQVNYGTGKIGKALNTYTQAVFRSLGAADAFLKAPALKSSLLEQAELVAKNQGLKGKAYDAAIDVLYNNPTPEMAKAAYEAAQFATFNNPNAISRAVSGAKTIGGKPAEVAIDLTVPFVRTPSNVAGRLIDYSPVGLIANVAKGVADKNQRQIVLGISRGATGSSIIAGGAVLAANGLLTGKYPSDQTERARWEAEGRKPNSILINGSWRQLSAVSPLGNLLGVGADVFNLATEAGKAGTDLVASTAFSAVNSLANQTFLKGLSGTVNAALNPEQYGGSYLNSFAGSLVPSIVGAAARGVDPNQREVSSPTDAIASRVPGLSSTLPARVDVTGKEVKRDGGLLGQFFDPFVSSKNKPNPGLDEVKRLRKIDSSLSLSRPGDSIKGFDVGKEGVNRVNSLAGGVIDKALNTAVTSPNWSKLDDTTKIRVVNLITDKARNFARTVVWTDTVAEAIRKGEATKNSKQIVNSFKSLSQTEKTYFIQKIQEQMGVAQGGF